MSAGGIRMRYSWGSMLRTARAPVAVLLLGGLGLTVPPQTRDMLAFLGNDRVWAAASFQLALLVLGGSAWFWSRAALAARFGIDDRQREGVVDAAGFDWPAFNWLPRLVLLATFLVGAVIAFRSRSSWTIAGAIGLGMLAVLLAVFRPRGRTVTLPPAPRGGLRAWVRGGARVRLRALLHRAPFGACPAVTLLALGLVPLALGVVEAFTSALRLPNLLAAVFPGPACAVLLLGLMIGPLTVATFVFDGLTLPARIGPLPLGLRRPPVLSLILVYVFVVVPALLPVHTVRVIEDASRLGSRSTPCSTDGLRRARPARVPCGRSSSRSRAGRPGPGYGVLRSWTECCRRSGRAGRRCSRSAACLGARSAWPGRCRCSASKTCRAEPRDSRL